MFKVGEIAILQNGKHFPEYNSKEVVVLSPLEYRCSKRHGVADGPGFSCYRVRLVHYEMPDGLDSFLVSPDQLRKRREIDQVVSWTDCAWRPREHQR